MLKDILVNAPLSKDLPYTLPDFTRFLDLPEMCIARNQPESHEILDTLLVKGFYDKKPRRVVKSKPKPTPAQSHVVKGVTSENKPSSCSLFVPKKDEFDSTEKLRLSIGKDISLLDPPSTEKDLPLFCFCTALLPTLASQSQHARNRCLQKIRQRLAYDLDEDNKYIELGYQKEYKKSEMQSSLMNRGPVWKPWILRYLSDYFQVNVIVCCRDLLVYPSFQKDRTSIILVHDRRRLFLATHSDGESLFDPETTQHLLESQPNHLHKLLVLSRYKANEVKQLAEALHIPIQKTGRNQNRKKDELYLDIKTVLGWLV